jgi:FKBP-type peptidyl-prolyl cis-trans isomerase FkpA
MNSLNFRRLLIPAALIFFCVTSATAFFSGIAAAEDSQNVSAPTLGVSRTKAGAGRPITAGEHAVVQYTGWLYSETAPGHRGTQFDSSIPREQPFTFTLGAHQVIPGWDQGVLGMQVGEKRELTIPPELGYGSRGADGIIPPNATLVFEVELIAIE